MAYTYYLKAGVPFSKSYDAGTTQEWVLLPPGCTCSCMVSFDSAGSASIQATNFPHDLIKADSAAFEEWDKGSVSAPTSGEARKISAIRLVRASGTPRLTIALADATAGLN